MMIDNVDIEIMYIVDIADEKYRTNGYGYWEILMGNSWEELCNCDELESEFREFNRRDFGVSLVNFLSLDKIT